MQRRAEIKITAADAGKDLLGFLCGRFSYHDRSEWQRLIAAGRITLDGEAVTSDTLLRTDDALEYFPETTDEPPVDDRFTILLDDPAFLIVNKSGNLPCHPAGRYFSHTLWALLKERLGFSPILVNRLDRETSGIVVIAKAPAAARKLGTQFERHSIEKHYTVFVEGVFPQRLVAKGWMTHDTHSVIRKKYAFIPESSATVPQADRAQTAETCFVREAVTNGISRLCAVPVTGRTHQLRATLCSLGFPVVGDKVYGVDETIFLRMLSGSITDEDRSRLRIARQALHASFLSFRHPDTGATVSCTAPLPDDLRKLG
jgi:RluA family pseudouridine synthase